MIINMIVPLALTTCIHVDLFTWNKYKTCKYIRLGAREVINKLVGGMSKSMVVFHEGSDWIFAIIYLF